MADRKISDLTALTTPAAGDYLPIVDISEPSNASKNKRITIEELLRGAPDGTAGAPSIGFESDPNTGIYSPGADQVAISTNGTERVEFGTSEVVFNDGGANYDFRIEGDTDANLFFVDASTDRVGIGAASPSNTLTVNGGICSQLQGDASALAYRIDAGGFTQPLLIGHYYDTEDHTLIKVVTAGTATTASFDISNSGIFRFNGTGSAERARIDSSGRLLVGTSSARDNLFNTAYTALFQIESQTTSAAQAVFTSSTAGVNGANLLLCHQRSGSIGGNTIVQADDQLGIVSFQGADGSEMVPAAGIECYVDGTPGANDMPGRLVFSVTADGASSPTEAMRIKNSRIINIANTPVYADNAAAKTGGLVDGDVYRTSTGDLKIVYT